MLIYNGDNLIVSIMDKFSTQDIILVVIYNGDILIMSIMEKFSTQEQLQVNFVQQTHLLQVWHKTVKVKNDKSIKKYKSWL